MAKRKQKRRKAFSKGVAKTLARMRILEAHILKLASRLVEAGICPRCLKESPISERHELSLDGCGYCYGDPKVINEALEVAGEDSVFADDLPARGEEE